MNLDNIKNRVEKLEILFSEQEYTVDTLNSVVTQQAQQIDKLIDTIELLKHQMKEFKKQSPESAIVDEKPPHY